MNEHEVQMGNTNNHTAVMQMIGFSLFLVMVAVGAGIVVPMSAEQREQRKQQLARQWMLDVHRIAAAEPARFSAYRMASLQCTVHGMSFAVTENGDIKNPVRCQVEDQQGRRVDFSHVFAKEIMAHRLLPSQP